MSVDPKTLTVPHVNAFIVAYLSARLRHFTRDGAWTLETRSWVAAELTAGHANPNPPWPPKAPAYLLDDLANNLENPDRSDLDEAPQQ